MKSQDVPFNEFGFLFYERRNDIGPIDGPHCASREESRIIDNRASSYGSYCKPGQNWTVENIRKPAGVLLLKPW